MSESKNKEISIVIFERNVGSDLIRTVDTIHRATQSVDGLIYEIIIVDDGSTVKPIISKLIDKPNVSEIIYLKKTIGISGAILEALNRCKYENILPVPGHNMYAEEAIFNVMKLVNEGDVVIGCRNNLARERPPIKKLASRVLRDLYRHLTFYYVGDIHGLILYRKNDLNEHLNMEGRHTNAISVVTPVLAKGGRLIQTVAPINHGHDDRPSRRAIDSIPHPRNVIHVLSALVRARKIYRKSILG
jgi:glycosyltransferase involved in cell wall biosynthesis